MRNDLHRDSESPLRSFVTLLVLVGTLAARPSGARTLEVPGVHPTIQSAVDAAADGDLVLVAPGTYFERVVVAGKGITLASHFYVTGDSGYIDQTVIDGFGQLPDGDYEDGSAGVLTLPGASPATTRVIGLTITHVKRGVEAVAPAQVLYSTITETNDAVHVAYGSNALVHACTLYANRDDGVDMNDSGWGSVRHSRIFGNGGDGLEIRLPDVDEPGALYEIRNNVITDNRDDGIQLIAWDVTGHPQREFVIANNLIADNLEAGVGLMCCQNSEEDFTGAAFLGRILLYNNTLRNNANGMTGGDNLIALNNLFIGHGVALKRLLADSTAAHNLFFANVTDYENAQVDPASTITGVDPSLAADSSLLPGSSAIDAGVAQFSWNGETVLDLGPGDYVGSAPDLGAYEFGGSVPLNQPPFVTAGNDQELEPGVATTSLTGVVGDDGLPGPLSLQWREVSGTGTVLFGDVAVADTAVTFLASGTYELELAADDGDLRAADRVVVRASVSSASAQVALAEDDAEEAVSSGHVRLYSSDLEMSFDASAGDDQVVGMRFSGLDLPPAVEILDAYVQFSVDETSADATSLVIEAQEADDAPSFADVSGNLSLRPRVPASVTWLPEAWVTVGDAGTDQRTPNLAALLQQVVDRPGWREGNSLVLLVSGNGRRVARSFDGAPEAAPVLHVEYATGTITPPTLSITAPTDGATFAEGEAIALAATASDPEDGDISAGVAWSSSLDGALGTGSPLQTALTAGAHVLAASVSDSAGLGASDAVALTVAENAPPTIAITSPADGATFAEGEAIALSAVASDAEDGDLSAGIAWTSDRDGALGTGSQLLATLSQATHQLTASVGDSGGLGASDVITVPEPSPRAAIAIALPMLALLTRVRARGRLRAERGGNPR